MNSCTWLWATKECFCMKSQQARFHNRPCRRFFSFYSWICGLLSPRTLSLSQWARRARELTLGEEREDEEEKKNLGGDKLVNVFENSTKNLIRLNGSASARGESRKRFLCDRISSQTTSERFVSLFLLSARRIESAPMAMTCHIILPQHPPKGHHFYVYFSSSSRFFRFELSVFITLKLNGNAIWFFIHFNPNAGASHCVRLPINQWLYFIYVFWFPSDRL